MVSVLVDEPAALGHQLGRGAEVGEADEPRARALYERLGYVAYAREPDTWLQETADGSTVRYETMCILMWHDLRRAAAP